MTKLELIILSALVGAAITSMLFAFSGVNKIEKKMSRSTIDLDREKEKKAP